ncbi:hypothetical protein K7B09_12560 [Thermomonas sp. RSS23]|uniref:Uncharacterized protein n=1 Tax=Thermomonas beijingensis TaxID=2872701 RepID=A0ABS7TH46_9GAMM|nr:hypothetical protein [Thermomonas beijingensis]MBZ4187153.1 hypothetical protein [Thermomonas beijingensis]
MYDPSDPNEQQDFRWSVTPNDAPSSSVIRLAQIIRMDGLLSIDKLQISRQDLLSRFNTGQELACTSEQFSAVLDELLQISVPMLDDGVESDYYFIHE